MSPGEAAFLRLQEREAMKAEKMGGSSDKAEATAPATEAATSPPSAEPPPPAKTEPPQVNSDASTVAPQSTSGALADALIDKLTTLEVSLAPSAPSRKNSPRRSAFAPDPIRQRTYFDLRRPGEGPVISPPHAESEPFTLPRALFKDWGRRTPYEAPKRRRLDVSAFAIAILLGLGAGLGGIALFHLASASVPVRVITAESAAKQPHVAKAGSTVPAALKRALPERQAQPEPGSAAPSKSGVGQALATLLADPPLTTRSPLVPPNHPAAIAPPPAPAIIAEAPPPADATPLADEAVAAAAPEPAPAIAAPETAVVERPALPSVAAAPPLRPSPRPSPSPVTADLAQPGRSALAYATPDPPPDDPVARSFLGRADPAGPTPEAQQPPGTGRVNSSVNLRAKPDNAAPVVAILAEGVSVRIVQCDIWCEVEAGGKHGFLFRKFVGR